MHLRPFVAFLLPVALAALALGIGAAPAAGGGGNSFPADCGPKLQDCVDLALPGDTVYVTGDTAKDELVVIGKSITLLADDGAHHPKVLSISIGDYGLVAPIDVTIEGLAIRKDFTALFEHVSGDSLTLRDVEIGKDSALASGISLVAEFPASFVIEDSVVRLVGDLDEALRMHIEHTAGLVTFRAVGNRITLHGNPHSMSGIDLAIEGSGDTQADIDNNTVWDVARCRCPNTAGVQIGLIGAPRVDVNVVGNSFERSGRFGLHFQNALTTGGRLALDVFDNVFAHAHGPAISLDPAPASRLVFRAGFNDFYGNGSPNHLAGRSAGPGNLHADPRFVDRSTGNLKLKASSPLIDHGQVCTPGGIAAPDAAGRARLAGPTVDMGAYERGAGAPTGVVLVGANSPDLIIGGAGNDILCGQGGSDELDGGAGRDYADGGSGPDFVAGGTGPDRLLGGAGNDILCANDSVHGNDHVDGGKGNDGFRADSGDTRTSVEHPSPCQG